MKMRGGKENKQYYVLWVGQIENRKRERERTLLFLGMITLFQHHLISVVKDANKRKGKTSCDQQQTTNIQHLLTHQIKLSKSKSKFLHLILLYPFQTKPNQYNTIQIRIFTLPSLFCIFFFFQSTWTFCFIVRPFSLFNFISNLRLLINYYVPSSSNQHSFSQIYSLFFNYIHMCYVLLTSIIEKKQQKKKKREPTLLNCSLSAQCPMLIIHNTQHTV